MSSGMIKVSRESKLTCHTERKNLKETRIFSSVVIWLVENRVVENTKKI